MNINLLPDKFYKNQATLLILFVFLLLLLVAGGGVTTVYLVSQQQVKTLQQAAQSKQVEKAKLTGMISKQKKEQSEEVQTYLTELKGAQVQFAEMAKRLDETVIKHQQVIENYQIIVPLNEGMEEEEATQANVLKTDDGQEVIQIDLSIKGQKLANIGALTEALNKIDWVHQAIFISSSAEEEASQEYKSVIQIQALKEKLPAIKRGGEQE